LEDEYFCDGLTEEIINVLAQNSDFIVIARTSAFAFNVIDHLKSSFSELSPV
jgi:TolB-like protein